MAKPAVRMQVVQVAMLVALGALLLRAAQVQLVQGRRWAEEAQSRRTERRMLEARRGALFDRHGTPLALTLETYHVDVAPNELRSPARDAALIGRRIGRSTADVQRALRKRYAWFAGPFSAAQVDSLRAVRGVHLEPVLNRFYPSPDLARAVIGRVARDASPSGLERTLEGLLAGTPGEATVLRDRAGRAYDSPARVIAAPIAGHDIVLTLDAELQEIAQRALDDALQRLDADGGDIVMLDPVSGEILAVAASQRDGGARASAFVDIFEPGSTAKIFAAAALLAGQRVATADRVSGENGVYRLPFREIKDDHPRPSFTLAEAIAYSSNIAMAKFAGRLEPPEQFGVLRDFGFGSPTGIEFPSESPGRLRPPRDWTQLSAASLAMGYELAVTPLQLAAAYGALANDGVLLRPTLVREIRGPDGEVRYRHRPEPVRRVVPAAIAARLRELLVGVVAGGTGSGARLRDFDLAAKTGTSRRVLDGHYASNEYFASFAAIFPANAPQLVLVVKLDNPRKGSYFAAQTAAPVTRSMLEQALAARNVALDRARLSNAVPMAEQAPLLDDGGIVPYVVSWPYRPDTGAGVERREIPEVAGRSLREAAHALHRRGFRVALRGWGRAHHTWPEAGDSARVGALVTLFGDVSR